MIHPRMIGPLLAAASLAAPACANRRDPKPAAAPAVTAHTTAPTPAPISAPAPASVEHRAARPAGPYQPITGTALFAGPPPARPRLDASADPSCAGTPILDESLIVSSEGAIRNVVVRVVEGVRWPEPVEPPAALPILRQVGCVYRPHVLAILDDTHRGVQVTNEDPALHTIHVYQGYTTLDNVAQVPDAHPVVVARDGQMGTPLRLKCEVHPWMSAYVWLLPHRYFAVTGDEGRFTLPALPAGRYRLEAWHEKLGTRTSEITLTADRPAEVRFTFEGGAK